MALSPAAGDRARGAGDALARFCGSSYLASGRAVSLCAFLPPGLLFPGKNRGHLYFGAARPVVSRASLSNYAQMRLAARPLRARLWPGGGTRRQLAAQFPHHRTRRLVPQIYEQGLRMRARARLFAFSLRLRWRADARFFSFGLAHS